MESLELDPKYSTVKMAGKCIKCLAEEEFGVCVQQLLDGGDNEQLRKRFELIRIFLTSDILSTARDKAEEYLSEGKVVKVIIRLEEGEPKYEIKVEED